jgi:hypothetical protein
MLTSARDCMRVPGRIQHTERITVDDVGMLGALSVHDWLGLGSS